MLEPLGIECDGAGLAGQLRVQRVDAGRHDVHKLVDLLGGDAERRREADDVAAV
jgi:hypothetical protein